MESIDELNQEFPSGSLSFEEGQGGLVRCIVQNDAAKGSFFLHGAHVESFQPANEKPVLWMSKRSRFDPRHPIRGGIPICWPWFGPHQSEPDYPQHGFARISSWKIQAVEETQNCTDIVLGLSDHQEYEKFLGHPYDLQYRISIGTRLTVELSATNTGIQSISDVGCALHSYFHLSNVEAAQIVGLGGTTYLDKLTGSESKGTDPTLISAETDRVYLEPPESVRLLDKGLQREIIIQGQGSCSTVVWNPWINKSRRMEDFPDDGFHEMVCIETANALGDVRQIEPGETHNISQTAEVKRI